MQKPVKRHEDARDLARGTGVNLLGNLGKLSTSVSFIFIGRVFGSDPLGLYLLAWSVIDFVSKLAIFGLDISIVKFITRSQLDKTPDEVYRTLGKAFSISLASGLSVSILIFLLTPWIAEGVFHKPDLVHPLKTLVFAIPLLAVSTVLLGAIKALKIMRFDVYVRSIIEPFGFLLSVMLSSLVWKDGSGLPAAQVAALLIGASAALVFFSRFFSLMACLRAMSFRALGSQLARFALPVSLHSLLNILMSRLDVLLIGHFLPTGRVGIYGIAREVANVIKDFRQACDPIFAPVISEQVHTGDRQRLKDSMALAMRWALTISLPYLGILIFGGHYILNLFGPAFVVGATAAALLAFAHLINSICGFSELLLLMSGRPYLNLFNTVLIVMATGVLTALLIPHYDILGPPTAAVLAFGAVNAVRLAQVYLILDIHPFRKAFFKSPVAFLVAAALPFLLQSLGAETAATGLVATGSFLLAYGLIIWQLKLETEEQQLLHGLKRRLREVFKGGDT